MKIEDWEAGLEADLQNLEAGPRAHRAWLPDLVVTLSAALALLVFPMLGGGLILAASTQTLWFSETKATILTGLALEVAGALLVAGGVFQAFNLARNRFWSVIPGSLARLEETYWRWILDSLEYGLSGGELAAHAQERIGELRKMWESELSRLRHALVSRGYEDDFTELRWNLVGLCGLILLATGFALQLVGIAFTDF